MLTLIAPVLEPDSGAIEYQYVLFQGALDYPSVYKGTPNKKLDEAWTVLTHSESFLFSMGMKRAR